ncbi:hypothetical protein [Kribbella sp. NPDC006257]|uniref:hypothetical protein n=1 Tax=Kribbella sp. NPDC006257 TaxID=3156738 RepID=UPI0033AC68C0
MTVRRTAPPRALLPRAAASFRLLLAVVVMVVPVTGCSVARRADGARPPAGPPTTVVPAVVEPPQPEGLDGSAGAPGPQVCTAISAHLGKQLGVKVTAKPYAWNDGGLPALDLCTLLLDDRPVQVGVSALPKQPDSLSRLTNGLTRTVPELGPDARLGAARLAFVVDDRVVRITSPGGIDRSTATGIDRAKAVAIGLAVRAAVPSVLRNARQADAACQVSNSAAERFVGAQVLLRRDYRVNGALTCIWGTFDATVSIVESFYPDTMPEAATTPPPAFAPIGNPGYYLPDQGELVFREGRRVVRVTGLTTPARPVSLDTLTAIVGPVLPLFIR